MKTKFMLAAGIFTVFMLVGCNKSSNSGAKAYTVGLAFGGLDATPPRYQA